MEDAFSTTDELLEVAMSKPLELRGELQEHQNSKILLDTGVQGLPRGWRVVICAGSVASPAILFRSGVDIYDRGKGVLLTDHGILFRVHSFRYKNPGDRRGWIDETSNVREFEENSRAREHVYRCAFLPSSN